MKDGQQTRGGEGLSHKPGRQWAAVCAEPLGHSGPGSFGARLLGTLGRLALPDSSEGALVLGWEAPGMVGRIVAAGVLPALAFGL